MLNKVKTSIFLIKKYEYSIFYTQAKRYSKLFDTVSSMAIDRRAFDSQKFTKKRMPNEGQTIQNISIYLLGNGSRGNPRALFVVTDFRSFLFNCGEGTQRLAYQNKLKLSRVTDIFFTSSHWDSIGGLPGTLFTIQDIAARDIYLHGPPQISKLFKVEQSYVYLDRLKLKPLTMKKGFYDDKYIKVEYVPLAPKLSKPLSKSKMFPSELYYSYIVKFGKIPWELDLERCVDRDVPPGPLLEILRKGQEITLPDGTIVKPEDVVVRNDPGFVFAVVECPNLDYIPSLIKETAFEKYQKVDDPTNIAALVVHFTPPSVITHPLYQKWLSHFSISTQHLYINESNPTLNCIDIHNFQNKLHQIHGGIFPVLKDKQQIVDAPQAQTMARYDLRPTKGFVIPPTQELDEPSFNPELNEKLEYLRQKCKDMELNSTNKCYPETLFFGTGSAMPSKLRNSTSILVTLDASGSSLMLDCGEGTLGQLFRFYGDELDHVLTNLGAIFISHLHCDHHMGLFSILQARKKAFKSLGKHFSPVLLLAPRTMLDWLHGYHDNFEPINDLFIFISNSSLLYNKPMHLSTHSLQNHLSIRHLKTIKVKHCKDAYGITVTSQCGHKIVFSGDTMPCASLIEAGKDCDLLIHEATMEDSLEKDALKKLHSTTSQALDVAKKMKARYTILTHFSQRYSKIPFFGDYPPNVGIAFDNMKVWPSIYPLLSDLIPIFKCMFAEEFEYLQERKELRQKRNELP